MCHGSAADRSGSVAKDGSPAEEGHYKANVDVMMAIDALELSIEMRPDVVILVTGDADFAYLVIKLRRHGIRVEVASVAAQGNPAARILNARRTWRDQSGQKDSLTENTEYARRFAANIKAYVDYFKKQNARVVNMSFAGPYDPMLALAMKNASAKGAILIAAPTCRRSTNG